MMLPSGPSEFVKKRLEDLRPSLGSNPLALDVAMGSGRNSVELVRHGFRVFGVTEITIDLKWPEIRF